MLSNMKDKCPTCCSTIVLQLSWCKNCVDETETEPKPWAVYCWYWNQQCVWGWLSRQWPAPHEWSLSFLKCGCWSQTRTKKRKTYKSWDAKTVNNCMEDHFCSTFPHFVTLLPQILMYFIGILCNRPTQMQNFEVGVKYFMIFKIIYKSKSELWSPPVEFASV